jgi:hypothetical protein
MAHGWGPDPLNNIAAFAGTYGDGTLIYPSELVGGHGPMPSIRLMLLRDAMEDYELMKKYPQWEYVSSENESDLGPISIPKSFYKFYRMYLGFIYKDEYDPEHHPTFEPTYFSKMWDQYYKRIDGTYRESPPIREGTLCPVGDPMPLHYFWRIAIPELQPKDHDGHPYYAGILPHPLEDTRIYPEFPKVSEIMWAEKEYLHVSVIARCNPQMNTDWVALEIASTRELGFPGELIGMDGLYAFLGGSNKGIIRWRFVITQKGNVLVEKQTNAGHFRVNNIPWKHELKPEPEYGKFSADKTSYVANFTIPRSLFERNKDFPQLRINVLYHHQKPGLTPTIDRWFPDAGNVFMMPQASIIPLDKLANM